MCLTSAEGYKDARVPFLKVQQTDEIWTIMKNVGSGMSTKNILFSFKRNARHI